MDDIASLNIRIQSLEVELADRRLKGLANSGGKAERATDGLMGSMLRLAGPVAIVAGAVAGLKKTVSVTREFDVLNAQLITATGNSENAAKAFEAIQDFAATTPFDLKQATTAFNQLVNLGLTPSERALTSYGNTASAMGKDLSQLVEAVADAATGEFERLKEFGIKTKRQGDDVTFTFRGVKTSVKNNAAEIEEYLTKLGENEFAGAMVNRMTTLDGAISNLGDEWDKLWLNISQKGVGDKIAEGVRTATSGIEELNHMLSSGEAEAYLDNIISRFGFLGKAGSDVLTFISNLFSSESHLWGLAGEDAVNYIIDAFKYLPENLKLTIGYMAIELATLVNYGALYGKAFVDSFANGFNQLQEVAAANLAGLPLIATKGFGEANRITDARLAKIKAKYEGFGKDVYAEVAKQSEAIASVRRQTLIEISKENVAARKAVDDELFGISQLRAAYDKKREDRAKDKTDRLAEFKINPNKGSGVDGPSTDEVKRTKVKQKESDRRKALEERELENLVESLHSKEEAIKAAYDRRSEIILKSTEKDSNFQNELLAKSKQKYEESLYALGDADRKAAQRKQDLLDSEAKRKQEKIDNDLLKKKEKDEQNLSQLVESLRKEEEAIFDSYNRRLAIILTNTEEGSEKQKELKSRLDEQLKEDLETKEYDRAFKYEKELLEIEEFYNARLELILTNTEITEELRTELEVKLTKDRNEKLEKLETKKKEMMIANGENIFGNLASISKDFAGEQSGIYKAMFAVSKAFAIKDSILKIQQGIAAASATPWPGNIAAIASTVSATAGIISTLQSTSFSGAYDSGGFIPAGKTGLVGEYGMEMVQGPATVTSRKTTEQLLGKTGGGNNINVNIENNIAGADFEVVQGLTENDVTIIARRVSAEDFGKNAENEFANPNSKGSRGISNNFKVSRNL